MSDPKQAEVLVEAAGRDISALRGMLDKSVFADEIFGLHTQQAAEKLLKAWLALMGEVYPLTHNLELLLDILQERGVATEQFRSLVEYTPFAGRIRYGAGDPSDGQLDRIVALKRIEALREQVMRRLPQGK
jgi:HEPN domain-containing protein